MTALFITAGAIALIAMCCWVAYDEGRRRTLHHYDDHMEIARALGAYGVLLRLEADATGVSLDELIDRELRIAANRRAGEQDAA